MNGVNGFCFFRAPEISGLLKLLVVILRNLYFSLSRENNSVTLHPNFQIGKEPMAPFSLSNKAQTECAILAIIIIIGIIIRSGIAGAGMGP